MTCCRSSVGALMRASLEERLSEVFLQTHMSRGALTYMWGGALAPPRRTCPTSPEASSRSRRSASRGGERSAPHVIGRTRRHVEAGLQPRHSTLCRSPRPRDAAVHRDEPPAI